MDFNNILKINIPIKTIERLSVYRRVLLKEKEKGSTNIFSHALADIAHQNPALVRRDLMHLKQIASTQKGYVIDDLIQNINSLIWSKDMLKTALVGVGNMGRAFINYFKNNTKNLTIAAGFDIDPEKNSRVIGGCRIYPIEDLEKIIKQENISIAVITVPENQAQGAADMLIRCGIRSIINVVPVPIKVPKNVYVENIDFTTSFEKAAYYAKNYSN